MVNVKIKRLNNKSRKGLYIYIKQKGKRGAYYKYKGDEVVDAYRQYYVDRYVKKKPKGSLGQYIKGYKLRVEGRRVKRTAITRQADRYIAKIKKKRPELMKAIGKGIRKAVIRDVRNAGNKQIRSAKLKIMNGLVLDSGLIELILQNENMKKLKDRFDYQVLMIGKGGEQLAETFIHGKTIEDVVMDLKKLIKKGEKIEDHSGNSVVRKLEINKYAKPRVSKEGRIFRTDMVITFRKAR